MAGNIRDLLTSERTGASVAGELSRLCDTADQLVTAVQESSKKRKLEEGGTTATQKRKVVYVIGYAQEPANGMIVRGPADGIFFSAFENSPEGQQLRAITRPLNDDQIAHYLTWFMNNGGREITRINGERLVVMCDEECPKKDE
jgi:hypothetical protein